MPCAWCDFAKKHVRVKASPNPSSLTVEQAKTLGAQAASYALNWQLNVFRVVLVGVFLFANAMDYYTTRKGLEAGLKEGNIFAKTIMKWGWKKYQAVKLVGPALYAYQALTSEDPYYVWTASLAIGAGAFAYAAIQNWLLISGRREWGKYLEV